MLSNNFPQIFILDDDMVEYIQANEVFDISVGPNEENKERIDVTLHQIEDAI